jgi:hypothetical protein
MSVNVPINMKIDIEFNSGAQLPMDAIPELARLAEAHGFDCAWGGEANNKDPTAMLSAIAAVTTRLKVDSVILPMIAATSAPEVVEQIKPYIDAGATRIILPYVASSDDIVGEMKNFIAYWTPATTGLAGQLNSKKQ